MSALTASARQRVQSVIEDHLDELRTVPGFVAAEPGFPLVDGAFITKPAVIVWVSHKVPTAHLIEDDYPPAKLADYPVHVMQADPVQQLEALAASAREQVGAVAATYTYTRLEGNPIDTSFTVKRPILCHVGPDAGWPALKTFLTATKRQLSVSIYDFNAKHIATTLIQIVLKNGLEVVMNWDDSPRVATEIDTLKQVRTKLRNRFRDAVVQTGSGHRFANSYHEKVAVRDSKSFWLSSGNWTVRSQPDIDPLEVPESGQGMYGKYNREWHVIVEDAALAKLFETYIRYDFEQSEKEAAGRAVPAVAPTQFPDVFVPLEDIVDVAAIAAKPQPVQPMRLPATRRNVRVQPVLTPDNYVDRVTALLASAKQSVYMQFAYITYSDATDDEPFRKMLNELRKISNNNSIDAKIIVGNAQAAAKIGTLVSNGFNQKVFRQQTNIHNKGIVVDGETVLVSSANWSSDGVLRNRDAGLIISDREIAGYYQDVFLEDWNNRATPVKEPTTAILAAVGSPTPPGMARISWLDYIGD